jgi:hypothetical protein
MILENLHIHARRVVVPQMRRDLDSAVDHVIVPDKAAYETDDDDWPRRNWVGCIWRTRHPGAGGGKDDG